MIFLAYANKLIRILNDKASPSQIAGAAALGAIAGLLPGFGLLSLFVFCVIFLVNVNLSAAFFAAAVFKAVAYVIDPLAHQIGLALLVKVPALKPLWTSLYNIPFVPFTRFNNTVMLGSLVLGMLLFLPLFVGTKRFVIIYRERWRAKVDQWKIVQIFKASKIYSLYQTINNFRGS